MIAKRIPKQPNVRDDYSHLGRYVAAAKEKGEKLDKFWLVNCDAGTDLTDLETALIEIEATRTMASADVDDKTYHLVVSFRPGEQDKLSLERPAGHRAQLRRSPRIQRAPARRRHAHQHRQFPHACRLQ